MENQHKKANDSATIPIVRPYIRTAMKTRKSIEPKPTSRQGYSEIACILGFYVGDSFS